MEHTEKAKLDFFTAITGECPCCDTPNSVLIPVSGPLAETETICPDCLEDEWAASEIYRCEFCNAVILDEEYKRNPPRFCGDGCRDRFQMRNGQMVLFPGVVAMLCNSPVSVVARG